jgi:cytidylate kinase
MTATSMEVATDVFRNEYMRLLASIESNLRIKENAQQAQRDGQIQLDIDRGKVQAHRLQLDLRESRLAQRQEQTGDSDLSAAENVLSQAQRVAKKVAADVAAVSRELERSNSDISEMYSELYSLEATKDDVPIYKAAVSRLLGLIREQSAKVMQAEELATRNVPVLTDLEQEEESECG